MKEWSTTPPYKLQHISTKTNVLNHNKTIVKVNIKKSKLPISKKLKQRNFKSWLWIIVKPWNHAVLRWPFSFSRVNDKFHRTKNIARKHKHKHGHGYKYDTTTQVISEKL